MRMSCNGCRVLRKGCSDNCAIRPCLQWLRSPEAQANATVFLAKFYGRAGLINLVTAGPESARPAIFRSLLYEACGRMLNPVYGSVGMLWSGNWQQCQAAVESVLRGVPIAQMHAPPVAAAVPPLRTCDIRHVARKRDHGGAVAVDLRRMGNCSRAQFKRPGGAHGSGGSSESTLELVFAEPSSAAMADIVRQAQPLNWARGELSHESDSHDLAPDSEHSNTASVDTVDGSHVSQIEAPEPRATADCDDDDGLDLTLGLLPPAVLKTEPVDAYYGQDYMLQRGFAISASVAR